MSDSQADLSDATRVLGRLLPQLSEALSFSLQGAFGADMPGCRLPGMYVITAGELWIHADATPVCLVPGDVVLWPTVKAHRVASERARLDRRSRSPEVSGDGMPLRSRSRHGFGAELHVLKLGNGRLPRLPGLDHAHVLSGRRCGRAEAAIASALLTELMHGTTDLEVVSALVRALWLRALRGRIDVRATDAGLLTATLAAVEHPADVASVTELARRCGLSRSRFHERFLASYGESPRAWLQRVRMQHARELLADARISVAEVAARLGYQSESAFRKAYRHVLGMPARAGRDIRGSDA